MPRFDASSADCFVYTYKEGLLSAVAHDLKLRVTRFSIDVDDDAVRADFAADSLRVLHAIRDGRDDPSALSPADRQKIENNIVEDVLLARRYPSIRFVGRALREVSQAVNVEGELSLHGKTNPIRLRVSTTAERWTAEVVLSQPDFGIKPYTAMLGTLRVRPDVRVAISLPAQPR
jgi:hypothetical protein